MTSPVVNTLPSAPSRNQSPDAFVETADTWVAALPSWTTSVNALGSWMNTTAAAADADASTASTAASVAQTAASNAVNAPGTSATSTTPLTPSIASKSLTIQTGKAFSVGQFVVIADTANPTTNYMIGNITSYNSGTGALVVNVTNSAGVAASAWTISLTGAPAQNSLSNNLTFLGSGRRIYGDFSDSTLGNRLSFQSSIANGTTGIVVIPNGTSTQTSIVLTNNSDSNNASATFLSTTSAECQIGAAKMGTGSTLPLKFYTSGVPRFSLSPTESRFQADFSNATLSNRLMFQSSIVDNPTSIGAIPNGTSSYANFTAFASSNPDQSALIQIAASSTEVIINSTRTGTASYLPLTFYTNNTKQWTIDSSGRLLNSANSMPRLLARRTGTQTAGRDVLFDVVVQQSGNNYDTGTGVFTAPIDGTYAVSHSCTIANVGGSAANINGLSIYVSGSIHIGSGTTQIISAPANGGTAEMSQTMYIYMTAGTTVKVRSSFDFTGTVYLCAGCTFSIAFLY